MLRQAGTASTVNLIVPNRPAKTKVAAVIAVQQARSVPSSASNAWLNSSYVGEFGGNETGSRG